MAIRAYSLARDGNKQLSANFRVREFACNDGSDYILIDDALVEICQKVRDHFKVPVNVNSGFRNLTHNRRVGSNDTSQHVLGKAADLVVRGVAPATVAAFADSLCIGGVGLYKTFTHIDTRAGRSRWNSSGLWTTYPATFISAPNVSPAIRQGEHGIRVVWLQAMLNKYGYGLVVDGRFGPATDRAVRLFQASRKITVDGVVGNQTKSRL